MIFLTHSLPQQLAPGEQRHEVATLPHEHIHYTAIQWDTSNEAVGRAFRRRLSLRSSGTIRYYFQSFGWSADPGERLHRWSVIVLYEALQDLHHDFDTACNRIDDDMKKCRATYQREPCLHRSTLLAQHRLHWKTRLVQNALATCEHVLDILGLCERDGRLPDPWPYHDYGTKDTLSWLRFLEMTPGSNAGLTEKMAWMIQFAVHHRSIGILSEDMKSVIAGDEEDGAEGICLFGKAGFLCGCGEGNLVPPIEQPPAYETKSRPACRKNDGFETQSQPAGRRRDDLKEKRPLKFSEEWAAYDWNF